MWLLQNVPYSTVWLSLQTMSASGHATMAFMGAPVPVSWCEWLIRYGVGEVGWRWGVLSQEGWLSIASPLPRSPLLASIHVPGSTWSCASRPSIYPGVGPLGLSIPLLDFDQIGLLGRKLLALTLGCCISICPAAPKTGAGKLPMHWLSPWSGMGPREGGMAWGEVRSLDPAFPRPCSPDLESGRALGLPPTKEQAQIWAALSAWLRLIPGHGKHSPCPSSTVFTSA